METLPIAEVRDTLSALVRTVSKTHERVAITRNGRLEAYLVAAQDLDAMEETLAILADRQLSADVAEGRAQADRGELMGPVETLAFLRDQR